MEHLTEQLNMPRLDPSELLRNGIAAAKLGNKEEARSLLLEAVKIDPFNELPWLWLAWTAQTPKEAIHYVEKVLEINPHSKQANEWLTKLKQFRLSEAVFWQCPLCNISLQSEVSKCPRCRAILTLADIDLLLKNSDVDRNLIQQAIERLQAICSDQYSFEQHFQIGLAYLNEKKFAAGIEHLRAAARINNSEGKLLSQIVVLERKLAEAKELATSMQQQKSVLVIDDSPTIRKLVAVTLERQGYKVMIAADGMQALATINESRPDLVLLDITMPYMDGHQVCKVLKGNETTKQVPIVMLSGKDGFIDKVRARISGATDFVTKPVDPNLLLAVVQKNLKNKR